MRSSLSQIEKFFESSVWLDIRELFEADLSRGLNELTNPDIQDISAINYARGKIEVIKEMLYLKEKLTDTLEADADATASGNEEENKDAEA